MMWTPDQDAYLRGHYKRNGSAQKIAAALGVSRDAVIGRAKRIGLSAPRTHAGD